MKKEKGKAMCDTMYSDINYHRPKSQQPGNPFTPRGRRSWYRTKRKKQEQNKKKGDGNMQEKASL